jgi:hypothetical protein
MDTVNTNAALEAGIRRRIPSGVKTSGAGFLRQLLDDARRLNQHNVIRQRDRHAPAMLSRPQERLWLMNRLEPGSPRYVDQFAITLDGQ